MTVVQAGVIAAYSESRPVLVMLAIFGMYTLDTSEGRNLKCFSTRTATCMAAPAHVSQRPCSAYMSTRNAGILGTLLQDKSLSLSDGCAPIL